MQPYRITSTLSKSLLPLAFLATSIYLSIYTLNVQADTVQNSSVQNNSASPKMGEKCDSENGPMHRGFDGHGGGPMEELNLNDAQRTAFRKAAKQMHQTMLATREMHEALRDVVNSDNYSEKKAREIYKANSKKMEDSVMLASGMMHDFYASLTPDQKVKFNEIRKQMNERMKNHRHDHRHHFSDQDADEASPST